MIKYKTYFYLLLSFIGVILSSIYNQIILNTNEFKSAIQNENTYLNIFIENVDKLSEFKLSNILLILTQEVLIDKVLSLFIFLYVLSKIFIVTDIKRINLMNFILIFNTFLVFYLYATVWQNIELGSAYRYIFSFVNIFFIDFAINMDKKINPFQKIGPSNLDQ